MVALIYYGGVIVLGFTVMVVQNVRIRPRDAAKLHQLEYFDLDKNCETVYIHSPVEYYDGLKSKSDKTCVIRVLTYNVHGETEPVMNPASTLDPPSQSVSGVLEVPSKRN
jgi:hypothetical protein